MQTILSDRRVAIACTIIVCYIILNSQRTVELIGAVTTVLVSLFIIVLNTNPDILVHISTAMISLGTQYYMEGIDSIDD